MNARKRANLTDGGYMNSKHMQTQRGDHCKGNYVKPSKNSNLVKPGSAGKSKHMGTQHRKF